MGQSKGPEDYTQRLTECATLAELRDLMALYSDLAIDAGRVVAKMADEDFTEFRRGLKMERKGRFAGEPWCERFGAILMPLPMLRISEFAHRFHAPFEMTWQRLKDIRPDLLIVAASKDRA